MLKVALTKGRVEEQVADLLAARGWDVGPLKDKQRRLIINLSPDLQLILAKGPDVLTYLINGVVDLGIVGNDVLMEQRARVAELLDLGVGRCQFILASTADFDPQKPGRKVIATKYPRVAQNYFARRGEDVEIIRITGSVELAPLIGLADAIIDITETGRTLKENHLVVYDRLDKVSTRLVANQFALKQKRAAIYRFARALKGAES